MATNGSNTSIITNSTFVISDTTLALNGVGSCLSIFGAIFMFWSYAYVPEVRNYTRQLLLYLTTADVFSAVGYLMGVIHYVTVVKQQNLKRFPDHEDSVDDTDAICIVQSFLIIYSNLASYLWTILIAGHIFAGVVYNTRERGPLCNVVFHVVSWGVPAAIAITAAGYGVLGQDTSVRPLPWCFLRSQTSHRKLIFWTFMTSIGWEIMTYLVTSGLYIYMKCLKLYRRRRLQIQNMAGANHGFLNNHDDADMNYANRDDRNFLFVWLILYVLKLWGTIRLFIITAHPSAYSDPYYSNVMRVLLNMQSFATTAQAFGNSVIFCFCDKFVIRKICSCCRGNGEERQPLLRD